MGRSSSSQFNIEECERDESRLEVGAVFCRPCIALNTVGPGSKFAEEIRKGVSETSLLVILTDNYATREWCREEVMLAKEHQRPIAVV